MKKIIRNIVLAFCLPSFLTGCHFLEVEQLGKSDIQTYFSRVMATMLELMFPSLSSR